MTRTMPMCEQQYVPRDEYRPRRCTNNAKGQLSDGRWVCGVHMRSALQVKSKSKTAAQQARQDLLNRSADAIALAKRFGLRPDDGGLRRVRVDLLALAEVLEELTLLRKVVPEETLEVHTAQRLRELARSLHEMG